MLSSHYPTLNPQPGKLYHVYNVNKNYTILTSVSFVTCTDIQNFYLGKYFLINVESVVLFLSEDMLDEQKVFKCVINNKVGYLWGYELWFIEANAENSRPGKLRL